MSAEPAITIIGLGPGDPDRLTAGARRVLDTASRVFVRMHPDLDLSPIIDLETVTDIAPLRLPDGRWDASAAAICDGAEAGPVALAIPGHPRFGEGLVVSTVREADRRGLTTRVLDGISVIDLIATALGVDPLLEGAQCFAARFLAHSLPDQPFAGGTFTGSPRRPMLFTHVYDTPMIAAVASCLQRILPNDHEVIRIDEAGLPGQVISHHTVGELAGVPAGPLVALWVPAQETLVAGRDPRTMQHISARLRAPDGCPWDRAQTHESLTSSFLDEVYEVIDAIESGDTANLEEELGDLFLHIMLQAQIAEEAGQFTIEDVYEGIAAKIVRRHPHVFADEVAETQADLSRIWQRVKAEEKRAAPSTKPEKDVDGQPHSMPALTRATRYFAKHPLPPNGETQSTPEARSDLLLQAIAAIVQAGDDPERVLRDALREHVLQDQNRSS
ncbi:MAG: MazG family protein [Thermomicrobiales bacterium]